METENMAPRYECDQCGACCRHFLVEAYWLDVVREPRLLEAAIDRHILSLDVLEADEDKCILIAGTKPCKFLAENRCSIYPTRPNACVGMRAGDEQCQMAREFEGLPPLQPVNVSTEGATEHGT